MSIHIDQLFHRYDGQAEPAVDHLDLTVEEGELFVLLGPSGCGKTTTMRCIAGLESPAGGRISVGREPVIDVGRGINVPVHQRPIGMVFQSYAIWPHKTVAENVGFPLKMEGVARRELKSRVEEVLGVVGLDGYGDRGASLLSGGQMQRVALARSIAMRPDVLLLDEPLSNLDARLRQTLRFELRSIQQELGMTSIYVTHDQSEALALGDRIAVMRNGRIVQLDDPVTLYREPNSEFVAEFLGVSNILHGQVVRSSPEGSTVRVDDAAIEFASTTPRDVGAAVSVCIRDEEITLAEPAAVDQGAQPNEIDGIVDVASFLGSEIHYQVLVEGNRKLQVSTRSTAEFLRPGSKVIVTAPPDAVQLVEPERQSDDALESLESR